MKPIIKQRDAAPELLEKSRALDLHPVAATVLANRATAVGVDPALLLDHSMSGLDRPDTLPDIEPAAERIARAIMAGEVIGLATDHDVDGASSHAVLFQALVQHFGHPAERVRSYIGLRLQEGYGLSDSVCERILRDEPRPSLVVTADMGSSDAPRVTRLAQEGLDVIVTDHHGMPEEGGPEDALACVSPVIEGCRYPDPAIAGVMVAWLLMCMTRQRLIAAGHLSKDAPSLAALVDYVALGTIADCVSLARSRNNRIVVTAGLERIRRGNRPCWEAYTETYAQHGKAVDATDLAFGLAPMCNATGRLDDAMIAVRFLIAADRDEAFTRLTELNGFNLRRKEIQQELTEEAMFVGEAQAEAGRKALIIRLTEGHPGVHGIVASRLVESFGRPAICFSQALGKPGVLTGSARGVDGMHVRDAMQAVHHQDPELITRFGGHAGAGGILLPEANLGAFESAYGAAVAEQLNGKALHPVLYTDATVDAAEIDWELIKGLKALQPFGKEFEAPLFEGVFLPVSAEEKGASGGHWKFTFKTTRGMIEGMWFNAGPECPLPVMVPSMLVYEPSENWWRGNPKLQIIVRGVKE